MTDLRVVNEGTRCPRSPRARVRQAGSPALHPPHVCRVGAPCVDPSKAACDTVCPFICVGEVSRTVPQGMAPACFLGLLPPPQKFDVCSPECRLGSVGWGGLCSSSFAPFGPLLGLGSSFMVLQWSRSYVILTPSLHPVGHCSPWPAAVAVSGTAFCPGLWLDGACRHGGHRPHRRQVS